MKLATMGTVLGGAPSGGAYVDINQEEQSRLFEAGTGVVKSVFTAGAIGLGIVILLAALSGLEPNSPRGDYRLEDWQDGDYSGMPKWRQLLSGHRHMLLGTMDFVRTSDGEFFGVCLDESLWVRIGEDEVEVPIKRIVSLDIKTCECSKCRLSKHDDKWGWQMQIDLLDGSVIKHAQITRPVSYATVVGVRKFCFEHTLPPSDDRLNQFLEQNKIPVQHRNLYTNEAQYHHLRRNIPFRCFSIKGLMPSEIADLAKRLQTAIQTHSAQITEVVGNKILEDFYGAIPKSLERLPNPDALLRPEDAQAAAKDDAPEPKPEKPSIFRSFTEWLSGDDSPPPRLGGLDERTYSAENASLFGPPGYLLITAEGMSYRDDSDGHMRCRLSPDCWDRWEMNRVRFSNHAIASLNPAGDTTIGDYFGDITLENSGITPMSRISRVVRMGYRSREEFIRLTTGYFPKKMSVDIKIDKPVRFGPYTLSYVPPDRSRKA